MYNTRPYALREVVDSVKGSSITLLYVLYGRRKSVGAGKSLPPPQRRRRRNAKHCWSSGLELSGIIMCNKLNYISCQFCCVFGRCFVLYLPHTLLKTYVLGLGVLNQQQQQQQWWSYTSGRMHDSVARWFVYARRSADGVFSFIYLAL